MDLEQFRREAHVLVDWMADYLRNIRSFPVKSQVSPGEIMRQLSVSPPPEGEPFSEIMGDFERLVMPGITHWQHPSFFAYFQANTSPPSILAEMLTATIAAQCMIWQTSPAAAELEEMMMHWLGQMIGLPPEFDGVIQDTASTATLCSLLTAREKMSDYQINERGFIGDENFVVYASSETHSSIEKAVRIAGFGRDSLHKVAVDGSFALQPGALLNAVKGDLQRGKKPLAVVATIGTTGSHAVDPLGPIAKICAERQLWLHVDAAHLGTALLLPEYRWMLEGIESADSFVFNPHKWMLTNFDCSAYFIRDRNALLRTFEITPEYLKTGENRAVNDYRDWGIQLGRRFRALKLWFVIRSYGVNGLQAIVRRHIHLAQELASEISTSPDFELLVKPVANLICFRYHPSRIDAQEQLNELNAALLQRLNATGKLFLTHTKLRGDYTLRLCIGQTEVSARDVEQAWELIRSVARSL